MLPLKRLTLSTPIPHNGTNAATSFSTNVASFSATNAATYTTTGADGEVVNLALTNRACVRFVSVHNLDAAGVLYVNVGNTLAVPPDPSTGSFAIPAGGRYTFAIQRAEQLGVQGLIKVVASGTMAGSIQWHP